MLLGRAFVLSFDTRGALAALTLAMAVTFALFASGATAGLDQATSQVSPELLDPPRVITAADGSPFPADSVDANTTVTTQTTDATRYATIRPWPFQAPVVQGPYAGPVPADLQAQLDDGDGEDGGAPVVQGAPEHGPWDAIYLEPSLFDQRFPELAGQATEAYLDPATPVPAGFDSHPAKASGQFFVEGARQVTASVHLVVVAMGALAAVLASGAIRLEVMAKSQELATLEVLGGKRRVRRVVAGRAAVLAGLGTLVGLGVTLVLARLVRAAAPGFTFALTPWLVAEILVVSFLAAWIAGTLAGLREAKGPVAPRLGKRGLDTRRFPGPFRFLLVTPRLFVSVFAAALVTTAIIAVTLGSAQATDQLVGSDEGVTIIGATAGSNPFTGRADRFLGEHATVLPEVKASSPEAFAPTMIQGQPVLVRGVDHDAWRQIQAPTLVEGTWPDQPGQALVGQRLARTLEVDIGDTLPVPGAYRSSLAQLTVTGIHAGTGLGDDEVITDLDTVAGLAGLPPGEVHLVRLQATDPDAADRLPGPLGIEVLSMTVEPTKPVVGARATAHLDLINLADHDATRHLAVRVNDHLVASQDVRLGPSTRATTQIGFPVPDVQGPLEIQVNPSVRTETGPSDLSIIVADRVPVAQNTTLRVATASGAAASNATVHLDGDPIGRTDPDGRLTTVFETTGRFSLTADRDGASGGKLLHVTDPAWNDQAHLDTLVVSTGQASPVDPDTVSYTVEATLINLGGVAFDGTVPILADGTEVATGQARVAPLATSTMTATLEVPIGTSQLQIAGTTVSLEGATDEDGQARTIDQVLAEQRRKALEQSRSPDQAQVFLDELFGDLRAVVVTVVLITFLHAGIAVTLSVLREVRERGGIADTLLHLGASREDVAFRALRDASLSLVLPVVLGSAAALGLLALATGWGFPPAFGHTLPADVSWTLLLRMAAALIVVGAAAAIWGALTHQAHPGRQAEHQDLATWLEGSP